MYAVVRLDESCPVKYGLRLSMDEKYRGVKKQLSELSGIPASQLLLVDVYGALVRVSLIFNQKLVSLSLSLNSRCL